jgi:hypothetical protein
VTASIDAPAPASRPEPERRSLNIWPHVVPHLYPDGTRGAESPLRDATWERLESQARQRRDELAREIEFIDRWIGAMNGKLQLRV